MKSFLKRIARMLGFEIHRYSVKNSDTWRLMAMLTDHEIDVILDVGANTGGFAKMLRDFGYDGKIVSFEPCSKAREYLLKNSMVDPLWEIAPRAAIGAENTEVEINIAANSSSSSVLDMMDSHISAAPHSRYIDKETVPLKTLDDIAPQYFDSKSKVFLKIDTQGYESMVLDGAEGVMENVVGLQLEMSFVSLYKGQVLYDELIERLKAYGFNIWAISTVLSDPNTGRLLQIDAVFFRD